MEANLLLDVDRGADDEDAGLEVQRSNPLCAPVRVGQIAVSGPGDPFLEFRGRCIQQARRSSLIADAARGVIAEPPEDDGNAFRPEMGSAPGGERVWQ